MQLNPVDEKTYLDRFRVSLILLVVIGHATRMFCPNGLYNDRIAVDSMLEMLTKVIYSFHMPFFVMISGYVYGICVLKSKDYASFLLVLRKKVLRLIVPYLFWGICYVAPIMIVFSLTPLSYGEYVKTGILLSLNSRQLWYLAALFVMFILVHGIRCLLERFQKYKNIPLYAKLIVFMSIAFMLRNFYIPPYFQLSNAINYLPYFLLGYYIKCVSFCSLFDSVVLIISTLYVCFSLGIIGFISIATFCCFIYFMKMEKLPLFYVIKKYGMGIYILHPMMFYAIYYYYPSTMNPVLFTSISIVVVIFICVLICRCINHMKLSYLLGE